ncbi:MAG: hypothetical protein JWO67_2680, partial [Streptosporangiaceae bacterium]|nr:hypothetical protein [Streptosporangiaceae bacterium]
PADREAAVSIEIREEDFADWDSELVSLAGAQLFSGVADIVHHNAKPGEGWDPFADPADVPAVIAEVRGHIERFEAVIKKARADIAGVERNARLAARRRQRAEKKAEKRQTDEQG